jgi:hypothetical protein
MRNDASSGTGFSLCGLTQLRRNPHRLKPVPLKFAPRKSAPIGFSKDVSKIILRSIWNKKSLPAEQFANSEEKKKFAGGPNFSDRRQNEA